MIEVAVIHAFHGAELCSGGADQITRRISNLDRKLCDGLERRGGTDYLNLSSRPDVARKFREIPN